MYSTIKLIRFFLKLFLKTLLFPFRLITGFLKAANSAGTDDSIETWPSNEVATIENSTVNNATAGATSPLITTESDDGATDENSKGPESVEEGEFETDDSTGDTTDEIADEEKESIDADSISEDTDDTPPTDDADDVGSTNETVSEGQTDKPSQNTTIQSSRHTRTN